MSDPIEIIDVFGDEWWRYDENFNEGVTYPGFGDGTGQLDSGASTSVEETDEAASVVGGGVTASATSYDYPVRGLADMAWAQHPYRVLWGARSDGLLVGMTHMPDQQIAAWHRHPMQNGAVEAVTVIPSPAEHVDRVWMVVRRTINGQTRRYVEYMTAPHQPTNPLDTAGFCFVDASIVYDGAETDVITGLDHLEGAEVAVWGDGVDQGSYTVESGSITLATAVSYAVIGLNNPSRIVTLPLETGSSEGVGQGKRKLIGQLMARVVETGGIAFSTPPPEGQTPISAQEYGGLRRASAAQDTPTPLYSGDIKDDVASGWEDTGQITVAALRPYPLTVLALVAEIQVAA